MKTLTIMAALGLLCLPVAPALAATAHNSQAGALGPTTNDNGPTGMNTRKKQMSGKHMKRSKSM
jgi:hypothetical protein